MFPVSFIWFPFHFPLDTPSFPLSFRVFLSSCLVISSLFFFCAHMARHLACTCAQPTFNLGFRSPRSLQLGGFSSVVPVHLVPFHRNHAHLCPVLSSFHVFFRLSCCAHTSAFVWALEFFASTRGGGCVCVWCVCTPWNHRRPDPESVCEGFFVKMHL